MSALSSMWLPIVACTSSTTTSSTDRTWHPTDISTTDTHASDTADTGTPPPPPCGTLDRAIQWEGSGSIHRMAQADDGSLFTVGRLGSQMTFGPPGAPTLTLSCPGFSEAILTHLDPQGALLWTRRGAGCGALSMAMDVRGDRLAWGIFHSADITFEGGSAPTVPAHGGNDGAFAVYQTDGTLLWTADIACEHHDDLIDLAIGPEGEAYALGRYSRSGVVLAPERPDEIALASSDKLPGGLLYDLYLSRWNADGTLAWAEAIAGPGFVDATSVAVLDDRRVVVVGQFGETMTLAAGHPEETTFAPFVEGGFDGFAAGWTLNGQLAWAYQWGGSPTANQPVSGRRHDRPEPHLHRRSSEDPVFGDPPTSWELTGPVDAAVTWTADGDVGEVRRLTDGTDPVTYQAADTDAGWLAAGGTTGTTTFGTPPNEVSSANEEGRSDPLVLTWRPDGSEACYWPIASDDPNNHAYADTVVFDGQGGLWATVTFLSTLKVLPGTPQETVLTDTTPSFDVALLHFQLEAPSPE
ncbi:MAG: hypothetical protein H6735_01975 [Alphaproteobacteria bacterium]|nr:hypothetical protein [Alphaproteobacteria bacterium]